MALTNIQSSVFDPMAPAVQRLINNMLHPVKFKVYQWWKLPSLRFWSVRVESVTPYEASVSIPYGWRAQNPFRSTYFAALAGAAELSTGLMGLVAIEGRGAISMLITGMQGEFIKKATNRTTFTCTEGAQILAAVQQAIDTGEGQKVRIMTEGKNEAGELVARFHFDWSFKVRP